MRTGRVSRSVPTPRRRRCPRVNSAGNSAAAAPGRPEVLHKLRANPLNRLAAQPRARPGPAPFGIEPVALASVQRERGRIRRFVWEAKVQNSASTWESGVETHTKSKSLERLVEPAGHSSIGELRKAGLTARSDRPSRCSWRSGGSAGPMVRSATDTWMACERSRPSISRAPAWLTCPFGATEKALRRIINHVTGFSRGLRNLWQVAGHHSPEYLPSERVRFRPNSRPATPDRRRF